MIPPPKPRTGPPPPRQQLPKGKYVKVVPDPNRDDTYKIVTAYLGNIVGPRLDKCKVLIYPDGRSAGLNLAEALEQFKLWEKFCEQNQIK